MVRIQNNERVRLCIAASKFGPRKPGAFPNSASGVLPLLEPKLDGERLLRSPARSPFNKQQSIEKHFRFRCCYSLVVRRYRAGDFERARLHFRYVQTPHALLRTRGEAAKDPNSLLLSASDARHHPRALAGGFIHRYHVDGDQQTHTGEQELTYRAAVLALKSTRQRQKRPTQTTSKTRVHAPRLIAYRRWICREWCE